MRLLCVLLSLAMIAGFTVAQDRQPQKKDHKEPEEKSKDVLARVAKDMQAAEERLKKTDPGDVTRKIQRDVIDGLEELIKQNSQQGGEGGAGKSTKMQQGGGGRPQSGTAKGGAGGKQGDRQDNQPAPSGSEGGKGEKNAQEEFGRAKGGNAGDPEAKDKDNGKANGKDEKEGTAKAAGKEAGDKEAGQKEAGQKDEKGQAKGNDPGSSQGQQGGLASVKNAKSKTKNSLAAETYRADWGHLPLTKRLEMDAYSRERFMPRYDEMLQQYYRTVAEQGKKKE